MDSWKEWEGEDLKWEERNGVLIGTFHRPERCNALSLSLLRKLRSALIELETRKEVRVLILRGAGRHFSSGLDLQEASEGGILLLPESEWTFPDRDGKTTIPLSSFQEYFREMGKKGDEGDPVFGPLAKSGKESGEIRVPKSFYMPLLVTEILYRLLTGPQVVIVAATGGAFGGGGGILSVSDLAIADESLAVGFPELHRGLTPSLLHPFLRRRLSIDAMKSLLITGRPATASDALRFGLIQEVLPRQNGENVLHRAEEVAKEILDAEPERLVRAKRLLNEERIPPTEEIVCGVIDHWKSWLSDKAREGVLAFLEKRPPRWRE